MMRTLAFVALAIACAHAIELDGDSFEEGIAGKSAFVKFLAPW